MKGRILSGLLAGLLLLALTGCGQEEDRWNPANDITIISREDGSGTRGAFVELFDIEDVYQEELVDMTTVEAQITNSTAVTMTTVAEDEYAIGYISLGSLNNTVRALAIDGVDISTATVKNGSYPVSRPFNIVFGTKRQKKVTADFVKFILSRSGQDIVAAEKFIPLDHRNAYQPAKLKGRLVVGGSSSVSPLMEKLAEAYEQLNPAVDIELQATDSTTGVTAVAEGSYDLGMLSRDLTHAEESLPLNAHPIALDGIAVIVNQLNDIKALSHDQVRDIYIGKALTWNEVIRK